MSDYSALDRAFHRIVLGRPAMGEMLFDLDLATAGKAAPATARPVFVTALARAGTTVLMRALHGSGQFASLTYADMPAVMAPNLWARMSRAGRRERRARERAHGDGVMVDFDAPEALEEVFWRSFCGGDYIRPDRLVPHDPDAEVLQSYARYRDLVCRRHGRPRYLAKNNNLMLRLLPLARAIPDAVFLVPVRDPAAQAGSLLGQHLRFRGADGFTADYMRWLVHREFGPGLRPYDLPGQALPGGNPEEIGYWLDTWIACYGHLLGCIRACPAQIRPVIYEDLGDPAAWARVAEAAGIPAGAATGLAPRPVPPGDGTGPERLARARAIYAALRRA